MTEIIAMIVGAVILLVGVVVGATIVVYGSSEKKEKK